MKKALIDILGSIRNLLVILVVLYLMYYAIGVYELYIRPILSFFLSNALWIFALLVIGSFFKRTDLIENQ